MITNIFSIMVDKDTSVDLNDFQPPPYELYMTMFEFIESVSSPPFDYTFLFDPIWWCNWIHVLQLENQWFGKFLFSFNSIYINKIEKVYL